MTTITITARAAVEILKVIASDDKERSVIALVWEGARADLKRGADGEAIWERQAPGQWRVIRIHPSELKGHIPIQIEGFDVITSWPKHAKYDRLAIDFVNGELVVI